MKQRIGLAVAWLVATTLAVGVASQAVGLVGDRAEEVPVAVPVVGAGQSALGPLTAVTTLPPTTAPADSTTTNPGTAGPATTAPPPTTPSTSSATTPQQSTSTPPSESTTTTTATPAPTAVTTLPPLESGTFVAAGGQVAAACTGAETITLQGAVPVSGWIVDVESSGPEKVKVEFEQGEQESKVILRCDGGRLISDESDR